MAHETLTDPWIRSDELGILSSDVNQVLSDRWNRFTMDPLTYLEAHHHLQYDDPQARWVNGLPMGNGDLGVMMYGPPDATTFCFGKTDLWDYTPFGESSFPSVEFPEFRRILAEQDAEAFDDLCNHSKDRSFQQITAKHGGLLRFELFPNALAMSFKQRLSLAHAETVQSWIPIGDRKASERGFENVGSTVTVTSFVHAARNVFVAHIAPDAGVRWHTDLHFSLWRYHDTDMAAPEHQIEGNRFWVQQELPGGVQLVLMGVFDADGLCLETHGGKIHGSGLSSRHEVTCYVTLVTSKDCDDPLAQAHANLDDALAAGFDHLRATHRQWWQNFWQRGYISTPWRSVEWSWYYALYLQASICRPGRMSPGLQGNWVMENYPAWNADFHNNINMQILYWGQYAANRLELGEPFYRLFWDVLPRVTADTEKYFGMRGARFPISMGPDGAETCPGPLLSTYIGASGWLAQHYWWHYQYSGDREFLRQYAYPMLKACALFYEDYLQEDADGKLSAFPTIFMEVDIGRVDGAGRDSSWDLPVIIRTFQMATEAACALGIDAEEQGRWTQILEHISPIPADEDGVWLEFADKGGLWHHWDWPRFMPIFPMELVGEDSGPELLRQQARATIEEYFQYRGEKAGKSGTFPGVMMSVAFARMGDAERAMAAAHSVREDLSPSGFVTGHDAYYIQVDAPPGMNVMLSEMLLQSFDGVLRVFPATPPSNEPVRFHSLRAQGGFLVTAERREHLTQYVIVQSLFGNTLRLRNPFVNEPDRGVQVKVYELTNETSLNTVTEQSRTRTYLDHIYLPGNVIEFPTKAGCTYLISKEIPWISTIPIQSVMP
jgi:alpha-L-fucosidase 2